MKKEKNVIFLDFDGVLNIKEDDFSASFENPDAIFYLNKLCLETGFDIVVSSSWRDHINYKKFLYDSGLDEKIKILGKTENCRCDRAYEIMKYVEDHDIDKFIIIDDAFFGTEYIPYHVQTAARLGFTKNKYEEALNKISNLK